MNEEFGYEYCKSEFPEVRRLMQKLGTEGVREHVGQTTWLDVVERRIVDNPTTSYIISDVRFDNEAAMIQRLGGLVVRLDRDAEHTDSHASESIEAIKYDVLYTNNGDLNDLRSFAGELIRRY